MFYSFSKNFCQIFSKLVNFEFQLLYEKSLLVHHEKENIFIYI